VTVTLRGEITTDDLKAYFFATSDDPVFSLAMHRLVVLTEVTGFPRGDDVRALAHTIRHRSADPNVRVAVVVGGPLTVGMANMFLIQAGLTGRFQLFTEATTALYWLLTGKRGGTTPPHEQDERS
jgi:hypothetical protein